MEEFCSICEACLDRKGDDWGNLCPTCADRMSDYLDDVGLIDEDVDRTTQFVRSFLRPRGIAQPRPATLLP